MTIIKDIRELDKWLDNMRDALVGQIQRGAEVEVSNCGTSLADGRRIADWHVCVSGLRDERGELAKDLVCLS